MTDRPSSGTPLRRGWTTGACATAATKAAATALVTGEFPDPVTIALPKGQTPTFPLARERLFDNKAMAAVVKDAGDDPDVTHGATIQATVRRTSERGIRFAAGPGVGMVTKPGLPIAPGEPAINPVPRRLMTDVVNALDPSPSAGWEITISIPGGKELAERTWNPRLGIVGGLSILGMTGVVNPFSCAAWIHSIHRGIDVARATGLSHVVASTGSTSEAAARARYPSLPDSAMIDMGDFAGGTLKYLRTHPIDRLTLTGGFAKMSKLAAGALDLHSGRSQVDLAGMARWVGQPEIADANTAAEALTLAPALAQHVANGARRTACDVLRGSPVAVEVLVVSRNGEVLACAR